MKGREWLIKGGKMAGGRAELVDQWMNGWMDVKWEKERGKVCYGGNIGNQLEAGRMWRRDRLAKE